VSVPTLVRESAAKIAERAAIVSVGEVHE